MQSLRKQCFQFIGDQLFILHNFTAEQLHIVSVLGTQFAPIANLVNSIGVVKAFNNVYLPRLTAPETVNGVRVPEPTTIVFSNLRRVVEMLSMVSTPQVYRQHFYDHNPLPGARWKIKKPATGDERAATSDGDVAIEPEDNFPLLLNPDNFMPEEYGDNDLLTDVVSVQNLLQVVGRKYPKYVQRIDFEGLGSPSILVSNDTANVRCSDLQTTNGRLRFDKHVPIEGERTHFWASRHLTNAQFYNGISHLVGERPKEEFITEAYSLRSKMSAEQEARANFINTCYNYLF